MGALSAPRIKQADKVKQICFLFTISQKDEERETTGGTVP